MFIYSLYRIPKSSFTGIGDQKYGSLFKFQYKYHADGIKT